MLRIPNKFLKPKFMICTFGTCFAMNFSKNFKTPVYSLCDNLLPKFIIFSISCRSTELQFFTWCFQGIFRLFSALLSSTLWRHKKHSSLQVCRNKVVLTQKQQKIAENEKSSIWTNTTEYKEKWKYQNETIFQQSFLPVDIRNFLLVNHVNH